MMTNEELVMKIHAGEPGALEKLLEQNKGYIFIKARRYIPLAEKNRALDLDDLLQSASMGLIEAVYHWPVTDPDVLFITVASFYIRKNIRLNLGILSTKQRIENVAPPTLLSTPAGEEGDTELVELIADPAAENAEIRLLENELRTTVRQAVDDLPNDERAIIKRHYFDGELITTISRRCCIDYPRCISLKDAGIKHLGRDKRLIWLMREYYAAPYRRHGVAAFRYTGTSATESAVIAREELMEKIRGILSREPLQSK